VQHVQHEQAEQSVDCVVCKMRNDIIITRIEPSVVVFLGRIFLVSDISFVSPCFVNSLNYPNCAHYSEEEHVDENKVFVGKEIGHAFDGKPHLHHRVKHHDVEEDEHGDIEEVKCLLL